MNIDKLLLYVRLNTGYSEMMSGHPFNLDVLKNRVVYDISIVYIEEFIISN